MKISYNWLKTYVPNLPEPKELEDVFNYHLCEVDGIETHGEDTVFNLDILPNRAHDLLSHLGIAKELSAILGLKMNDPTSEYKTPESKPGDLEISIGTENCRRFSARVIKNIKVGSSPEWVVNFLEAVGQRSINNIVDATNIVMLNTGQPTHAFDLDKIEGNKILVRQARGGEKIETLDNRKLDLSEKNMVIADSDSPLALAGVKGGIKAEVDKNTKNIVLEVANFDPISVRKTARGFGILTDAAKRFENGVSPEMTSYAMVELSALIFEMLPDAEFEDVVEEYPKKPEAVEIETTISHLNKKLGTDYSEKQIKHVFESLGIESEFDGDNIKVRPSLKRIDLRGPHDLVEEVGRFYGYQKVEPKKPDIKNEYENDKTFAQTLSARAKLLDDGYSEVMTYTFTKKGAIEVSRGPEGKSALRKNLEKGLKEAYDMNNLNKDLLGLSEIKMFEMGTVFPDKNTEEIHVAIADKNGVKEFTLEEFTKDLDTSSYNLIDKDLPGGEFKQWSKFPAITRDIAVWLPQDTSKKELEDIIEKADMLALEPRLVDEYQKDYKVSYAYRLVFQSQDKTLTDAEVEPIMENLYVDINKKGWEVR